MTINPTTASAGVLAFQNGAQPVATVNSSGTLNLGTTAPSLLNVTGGLTLQANSAVNFYLPDTANGTSDPNAALIVASGATNSLSVTGPSTIGFSNPSLGTFDLISYSGATTFNNFQLSSASLTANPEFDYQLVNGAGQVDLIVSPPSLHWSGLNGSQWDTSTANWYYNGMSTTFPGSNDGIVSFNDTYDGTNAPASTNVYIQDMGVTPAQVTFNNTGVAHGGVDYVIYDADTSTNGIMGSGPIFKNGAGTVTFMGANSSYTGAIAINGGQINIENSGALGSSSDVTVTVIAGAALQLQGNVANPNITTGPATLSITGAGVAASPNGALQSVTGQNTYAGPIEIGPSTTITSMLTNAGDGLTLSGGVDLQGNALTINGGGYTTISGAGVSDSGGTGTVTYSGSGLLTLSAANSFSGLTTISSGTLSIPVERLVGRQPDVQQR